jgi:hypothetical protein
MVGTQMTQAGHRNRSRPANLRRKNSLFAAAVTLIALTFLFYADEGGLPWMMWRDSPAIAVTLVVAGLMCGALWWRTPKD